MHIQPIVHYIVYIRVSPMLVGENNIITQCVFSPQVKASESHACLCVAGC